MAIIRPKPRPAPAHAGQGQARETDRVQEHCLELGAPDNIGNRETAALRSLEVSVPRLAMLRVPFIVTCRRFRLCGAGTGDRPGRAEPLLGFAPMVESHADRRRYEETTLWQGYS
jgi:hypothetical protein